MHNIASNINGFDEKLEIEFPVQGEIRKIFKEIFAKIEAKDKKIIFLQAKTVGRRILNNKSIDEIIDLINGRRFRIYHAIKLNNKIYIKFGWHKIKPLSLKEKNFILKHWSEDFFEEKGKFLIIKSGGVLFPESLLYKYNNYIEN